MAGSFTFGGISSKTTRQSLSLEMVSNPVIVDNSTNDAFYDYNVVVLSDEYYPDHVVIKLDNYFRSIGLTRYTMLCTLNCRVTKEEIEKEQKTGIIDFYKKNRSDYEKYIPKGCPIVTMGPALYSHLREDDIYPSHVEQRLFGKPYFWFSYDLTTENGHYIYPIASPNSLFMDGFDKETPIDSYVTNLATIQIKSIINKPLREPMQYPELKKHFITSSEQFYTDFYDKVKDRHDEILSWDLETSGLDFNRDRVGCITLSFDGIEGWYIPWKYVDKEKMNEIFGKHTQCGANLKFDVKYMWREGLMNARIDEDPLLIGHTLDETRSNSLKALAFFYTQYGGYERALDDFKEKLGKGKSVNYIDDIDEDILKEYAIMDAIVCRVLLNNIMEHMRVLDKIYPNDKCPWNTQERYYRDRRLPAANMYARLEYRGCYVDKNKLDDLRNQMWDYAHELEAKLNEDFGTPKGFEWTSATKVGKLLKKLGWENLGENKSGEYLVGDEQFVRWEKKHPEIKTLEAYRSVLTLINGFVGDVEGTKGWPQYFVRHPGDPDGLVRMHCNYMAMGTDSGRTRCSNPNLQNTPTRGKFAKEIKSCLVTPNNDEYYSVTIDYSSLQMRIAAVDCLDKNLSEAFMKPDTDIHSSTAWLTFCQNTEYNIEEIDVEKEDGTVLHLFGNEKIKTSRGEIFAHDLQEDDVILD